MHCLVDEVKALLATMGGKRRAYFKLSVDDLVPVLNASPKIIRAVRANAQPIAII